MNKTIVHITTVHNRRDTRIFYRECVGLHKKGFDIYLIVSDNLGNENFEGIKVLDIGRKKSRLANFFYCYGKIPNIIKEISPGIVHLHDPELLFLGSKISSINDIEVVFDIHENVSSQILDKPYLPKISRKPLSIIYAMIENLLIKNFHLVLAENSYESKYQKKGKSCITVLNMPDIEHFEPYVSNNRKGVGLFYIGGISEDRGLYVVLDALRLLKRRKVDFYMHYIGPISENMLNGLDLSEIRGNINFYGRMDSKKGFELSKDCVVGLSILKPIKNYIESYSTKIFEYMAIGLPVITSNFPLYKNVVEKHECGFCVEPDSSESLANKIETLLNDKELVFKMGTNGINAVRSKFNWSSELSRLKRMYFSIKKFER